MRIIAFIQAEKKDNVLNISGVTYHRIIVPLMMMEGVEIYITNDVDPAFFEKGCDIVLYSRTLPESCMETIKELQPKYGYKIALDIDDYWDLGKYHIFSKEYEEIEFAKTQVRHIKEADIVLTTHDRLYDKIIEHNPKCYIVPNAIPKTGQFDIKKTFSPLVRLFWQGSHTHVSDLEILQKPIESLSSISKKIKMVIAGYEENGLAQPNVDDEDYDEKIIKWNQAAEREAHWYDMVKMYTANLKHQYKIIPGAMVTEYYTAYEEADICLIPLRLNEFNSYKSNLKVLEAARMGLPVIASKVHPYLNMPINYCRSARDWEGHIKRLVQHPARREDEGEKLREWADRHFNFYSINMERKQIFEHEISKVNA